MNSTIKQKQDAELRLLQDKLRIFVETLPANFSYNRIELTASSNRHNGCIKICADLRGGKSEAYKAE